MNDNLKIIRTAVEEVFGEANCDFQEKSSSSYNMIIKIPQAIVRNERGQTHPITDLYVKTVIKSVGSRYYLAGSLFGARGEITADEYLAGYAHSHLNTLDGFGPFCLGSSPLSTTLANLQYSGISTDNMDEFYAFLFMIDQLANSESIAGVPHRRLSDVGKKGKRGGHFHIPMSEVMDSATEAFKILSEKTMTELSKIQLSIDLQEGTVKVVNPLCDLIENVLKETTPYRQLMASDGRFVDTKHSLAHDAYRRVKEYPSFREFTFKGRSIRLHVSIPSITVPDEDSEQELYAHDQVRRHLINRIETLLTNKLLNFMYRYERDKFENAGRKRKSEKRIADYKARVIFKDLVLVQAD